LLAQTSLAQLTLTVDNKTDNDSLTACTAAPNDCSLRGAIARANGASSNDTIEFDLLLFPTPQTITLTGTPLQTTNAGTLKINGRGVVTVSGGNSSVVFLINAASTVSLIGLTVIQGQGVTGGGIENRGILTVTNCTISQNTATSGGGGVDNFGTLTLIHSTISENTAGFLGGGILNSGSLTMLNSSVSNNTLTPGAGHNGGGIANGGDATLINTTVSGNSVDESTSWAGGISHRGRTFNLINSTVTNNSSGSGGGIDTHIASFNVRNSIIANNHAPREADCYCTPITSLERTRASARCEITEVVLSRTHCFLVHQH
jgi:hypothetical protein